jgi:hypothetical protein
MERPQTCTPTFDGLQLTFFGPKGSLALAWWPKAALGGSCTKRRISYTKTNCDGPRTRSQTTTDLVHEAKLRRTSSYMKTIRFPYSGRMTIRRRPLRRPGTNQDSAHNEIGSLRSSREAVRCGTCLHATVSLRTWSRHHFKHSSIDFLLH